MEAGALSGHGRQRLQAMTLSHFRPVFLRRIFHEINTLAEGMTRNNFSASQGIVALILAFWLEEQGPR